MGRQVKSGSTILIVNCGFLYFRKSTSDLERLVHGLPKPPSAFLTLSIWPCVEWQGIHYCTVTLFLSCGYFCYLATGLVSVCLSCAIREGGLPLAFLVSSTLLFWTVSKTSCFLLERCREKSMSNMNIHVSWSNDCVFCWKSKARHANYVTIVCAVTSHKGESGHKKLPKIVAACVEKWQLSCPVGII